MSLSSYPPLFLCFFCFVFYFPSGIPSLFLCYFCDVLLFPIPFPPRLPIFYFTLCFSSSPPLPPHLLNTACLSLFSICLFILQYMSVPSGAHVGPFYLHCFLFPPPLCPPSCYFLFALFCMSHPVSPPSSVILPLRCIFFPLLPCPLILYVSPPSPLTLLAPQFRHWHITLGVRLGFF